MPHSDTELKQTDIYHHLIKTYGGEILTQEEATEFLQTRGTNLGTLTSRQGLKPYSTSTITYRAVDLVRAYIQAQ